MLDLGLFELIFTPRLKDVLFSTMPDPVLYHCHITEIAANDSRSHVFADRLDGWHRDPDSSYVEGDPTHVSIFVYLTDVGAEDGTFEFVPNIPPTKWVTKASPYLTVMGSAGYSFAWHRRYYHRAAPNRGPVRRRLLKFSIQRNAYPSVHLGNPHFQKVLASIAEGDVKMDILLGRYQGRIAPELKPASAPLTVAMPPHKTLHFSGMDLTKDQLRGKISSLKNRVLRPNHAPIRYGG
jgi:hypothetical protein